VREDVPLVLVGAIPNLLKETSIVPAALVPTPVDGELLAAAGARAVRRHLVAR
jgi:hypothetical protein